MEIDPIDSGENFFIKKAKAYEKIDPYTAKAWILTAKGLSPNNFAIQLAVYKQEKADNNYLEAAKCFSHIVLTFQNQPPELRHEINQLAMALRSPDEKIRPEYEFYVEMFQYISYDIQNHILTTMKRDSDNCLDYCQLVLLLMKKFSQMSAVQLVSWPNQYDRSMKTERYCSSCAGIFVYFAHFSRICSRPWYKTHRSATKRIASKCCCSK